jgi:hypothetical protein
MRVHQINKEAFKESISDTILGTMVNFPLNYVLIAFCLSIEMSAIAMTVFMTSILFILAVIRKYYVRIHYANKGSKANEAN